MASTPVTTNIPSKIPVFDPDIPELRLVSSSQLDPTNYIIFNVPASGSHFKFWVSRNPRAEKPYAIFTGTEKIDHTMRYACTIRYDHLGLWYSGVKRLLSKNHRVLWIGPFPP